MKWQGLVNAVLYTVQFERILDAETADRVAHILVEEPLLRMTPEQEHTALREALSSGEPLTGGIPQPHGEEAVRRFTTAVLSRMDTLRPWPVPFRDSPPEPWSPW